jgi:Tfp pilus assembly protein PilV
MIARREDGFTLIEVVMATLLLVVGIALIGNIVSNVMRENFYSERHTQAVILVQNKIEDLLNAGYDSSDLNAGSYEHALNPVNATADSAGSFYLYWSIYDLHPIDRSKQIVCTAQWQTNYGGEISYDGDGVPLEVELEAVTLSAVSIDESN